MLLLPQPLILFDGAPAPEFDDIVNCSLDPDIGVILIFENDVFDGAVFRDHQIFDCFPIFNDLQELRLLPRQQRNARSMATDGDVKISLTAIVVTLFSLSRYSRLIKCKIEIEPMMAIFSSFFLLKIHLKILL